MAETQATIESAARVLSDMLDPHEAHVGIGDNVLIVYVTASKSVSKRLAAMVTEIDGFPVVVKYVGRVRPAGGTR